MRAAGRSAMLQRCNRARHLGYRRGRKGLRVPTTMCRRSHGSQAALVVETSLTRRHWFGPRLRHAADARESPGRAMQKSLPTETPAAPRHGAGSDLLHRPGAQLRASAERHDAVAAAGDLSLIKDAYGLDFGQIGLITLAFQLTASLLQPVVGMVHGPPSAALLAGRRHGLDARRPHRAGARRQLRHAADRRHADRHRLVDLPSRIRRAWPAWLRAAGTALPNPCSRSAARPGRRWGHCWRPSSSCRAGSRASPGSRCLPCWRWCCCCRSGAGTGASRRLR